MSRRLTNRKPKQEWVPSMTGAPTYFRGLVAQASRGIARGPGERGYEPAGWHLGIHLDEHLSPEAYAELGELCAAREGDVIEFVGRLSALLVRELPGCFALVPTRRQGRLIDGVVRAIAEGRLDFNSTLAEQWLALCAEHAQ
jgi:hypothetical protein